MYAVDNHDMNILNHSFSFKMYFTPAISSDSNYRSMEGENLPK